ncbi:GntR family transcriptional regulator [Pseudomonas marginalis]|uniref:GntR family transcriptional regulator n=1 Tax=Pseudomonas marginalis TaxID=298 RepID=UPI002B1CAEFD|nr:GntR family transcriptional regulator [Pseudomonas marginalis]
MKSEQGLYERLKQQILTLQLPPDQLLDEVALSAQHGVSFTSIRDIHPPVR